MGRRRALTVVGTAVGRAAAPLAALEGRRAGARDREAEETAEVLAARSGFGPAGGAGLLSSRLRLAGSSGFFEPAESFEAAFTEPTAAANPASTQSDSPEGRQRHGVLGRMCELKLEKHVQHISATAKATNAV